MAESLAVEKAMPWRDTLQIALRNIQQAKLRFALTSLGVVIATATLLAMVSFGAGLRRETIGNLETREVFTAFRILGARQAQSFRRFRDENRSEEEPRRGPPLSERLVERVSKLPGVLSIQPEIILAVQLRNGETTHLTRVRGAGPHLAPLSPYSKIEAGRFLNGVEGKEVVLPHWVAEQLGFDPAERAVGAAIELLTDQIRTASGPDELPFETVRQPFQVVGVLPRLLPTQRNPFYRGSVIPLNEALELWRSSVTSVASLSSMISAEEGRGREFQAIDVRVREIADLDTVREEVESWGASTFAVVDQMDRIRRAFLILEAILSVLGMIALVVASLGIANVLVMSVMERTQVIGIMKAIGGTDQDVRRIFLVEAGCIGLLGGTLGVMAGWCLTRVGHFVMAHYFQRQGIPDVPDLFAFPVWLILGAVGFSVLFSVASGLWPARRAARLDPVRALRTG